jgi:hypothetical protein
MEASPVVAVRLFAERSRSVAQRPSDKDRRSYYLGVEGTLLARTSHHALASQDPFGQKKKFQTIGQHPILSIWSDALVRSIKQALVGMDWMRFYPIRLGIPDSMDDWVPLDELILMVDVVPGSADWESGLAAASRCQQLLKQSGLSDMEVELREVDRQLFAGADGLRDVLEPHHWDCKPPELIRTMLYPWTTLNEFLVSAFPEFLGFEVAAEHAPASRLGTMGPIIQLTGRPNELYGLTCRHVAHSFVLYPSQNDKPWYWLPIDQGYTAEGVEASERRYMIQPCRDKWSHAEEKLRTILNDGQAKEREYELRQARSYDEEGNSTLSPRQEDFLKSYRLHNRYCEKLLSFLENAEDLEPRKVGYIAYMPATGPSDRYFFTDWALIRLDEEKLDPLPANNVILDYDRAEFFSDYNASEHGVMLRGLLPATAQQDRKSLRVAKRGVKTGLTFGKTNEIKAVVRTPYGDDALYWEWIVVADEDRTTSGKFSLPGDSGACVFTTDGLVVGIVTGGNIALEVNAPVPRMQQPAQGPAGPVNASPADCRPIYGAAPEGFTQYTSGIDLTFVTPANLLFEDIQRVTGSEASLVGPAL